MGAGVGRYVGDGVVVLVDVDGGEDDLAVSAGRGRGRRR